MKKRLICLFVQEPIEGEVQKGIAEESSVQLAHQIHLSVAHAQMQQFIGIENADIRVIITPSDALEAVQFWLLPLLEPGQCTPRENARFFFQPQQAAEGFFLEFTAQEHSNLEQVKQNLIQREIEKKHYEKIAFMGLDTPDCGARWINMAMTLCREQAIVGKSKNNSPYLEVYPLSTSTCSLMPSKKNEPKNLLPPLPKIQSLQDWKTILDSPIGGKLRKLNKLYR